MKNWLLSVLGISVSLFSFRTEAADEWVGDISHPVGFEQHLTQSVSGRIRFRDDRSREVFLGDYYGSRPIVLVFTYYECSNLCSTVIGNLVQRLSTASIPASVRPQILVLSVNPLDTPAVAARKKRVYLGDRGADADHWHFLTGDEAAIRRLAQETGLRYVYDSATRQYAHPAGMVLLTSEGQIAGYLLGFGFTSGQLIGALHDAAEHRVASPLERVLFICFHYDPLTGPHSATILAALKLLSAAGLLSVLAYGFVRRSDRRRVVSRAS